MKKHLTSALSLTALTACIYFTACKSKKETTKTTTAAATTPSVSSLTYTADIKQILDANCATTCHSSAKHKHDIDLSTYESAKEAAVHKSFLGAVNHEEGYAPMPPAPIGPMTGKLDQATIDKLTAWVKGGMPK